MCEILQYNTNEEYIEDKDSEGSNVVIEKEADKTEECALQGEGNGSNNRKLPLLQVQPVTLFHLCHE